MSDLTKLTAEEFRNQKILTLEMWEEALCRLERLEKCDAALNTIMGQLPTCGHETQAGYQSFCLSCVIRKLARAALEAK